MLYSVICEDGSGGGEGMQYFVLRGGSNTYWGSGNDSDWLSLLYKVNGHSEPRSIYS